MEFDLGGGIIHLIGGLGHLCQFSISNSDQFVTDVLRLCPRCSTHRRHCKGSNVRFWICKRETSSILDKSTAACLFALIWRRLHLVCPKAAGKHSWSGCWCSVGRPTLQFSIDEASLKNLNFIILSIGICPDTVLQFPVSLVVLWLVVLQKKWWSLNKIKQDV